MEESNVTNDVPDIVVKGSNGYKLVPNKYI